MSSKTQKIVRLFNQAKNLAQELLFPTQCLSCHRRSEVICYQCAKKISLFKFPVCPVCRKKLALSENFEIIPCPTANHSYPINFLFAATAYENSIIEKAIKAFKYKKAEIASETLAKLIFESARQIDFKKFCLVPVPLHPAKLRQRGFNQSMLLAQQLALKSNAQIAPVLAKVKTTPPQAELKMQQRLENQLNAFKCTDASLIKGKDILLIDDVATTGATLKECALVLKKNGAKKIGAAVVAG